MPSSEPCSPLPSIISAMPMNSAQELATAATMADPSATNDRESSASYASRRPQAMADRARRSRACPCGSAGGAMPLG